MKNEIDKLSTKGKLAFDVWRKKRKFVNDVGVAVNGDPIDNDCDTPGYVYDSPNSPNVAIFYIQRVELKNNEIIFDSCVDGNYGDWLKSLIDAEIRVFLCYIWDDEIDDFCYDYA